jgi:hypothetical protein
MSSEELSGRQGDDVEGYAIRIKLEPPEMVREVEGFVQAEAAPQPVEFAARRIEITPAGGGQVITLEPAGYADTEPALRVVSGPPEVEGYLLRFTMLPSDLGHHPNAQGLDQQNKGVTGYKSPTSPSTLV